MRKSAEITRRRSQDSDDAPEWSQDVFERAEVRRGDEVLRPATGTLAKRGRPKLENPKQQVTLRLDSDVIAWFRDTGPGWQRRINELLKKAANS
jgi:uncharacterized protein (DUF4415 family)